MKRSIARSISISRVAGRNAISHFLIRSPRTFEEGCAIIIYPKVLRESEGFTEDGATCTSAARGGLCIRPTNYNSPTSYLRLHSAAAAPSLLPLARGNFPRVSRARERGDVRFPLASAINCLRIVVSHISSPLSSSYQRQRSAVSRISNICLRSSPREC